MTTIVGPEGSLVGVGGNRQPFPKSSVPFSAYESGIEMLGDGRAVSYGQLYRSQIFVAATVNKVSRQISRLPMKVYKRTDAGRERVRTGRLVELLRNPFPGGAATHLKQAIAMPALINGNGLLRKVRKSKGEPPTGLDPLAWSSMRAIGDWRSPVEMWETTQAGQPRFIDPADVVHFAWRGVEGPIGVSPLRQLATTIQIEDAAQRFQKALLNNSAIPQSSIAASDAFLGMNPEVRKEILANLRSDVNTMHVGADNAGRPLFLPPGVTWDAIGHTAVEAELIHQRKLTREEIAVCYDVPPPLMGMLEKSTFNNITELHRMLYVTVLGPWLTLIEETFAAQLLEPEAAFRGDVWVEFDLSEVLKGDLLQRSQALALQIGYGVLTIDEARELENRERFDLPATKVPLYPANNLAPAGLINGGGGGGQEEGPDEEPSQQAIQQAAQVVAGMEGDQLTRLLAFSGGSVIAAILDIAKSPNGNGSHPTPTAV